MSHPFPLLSDPSAVLGRFATELASGRDLPEALEALTAGLGLRSVVLRDPSGQLLAVAGEVLRAVPAPRGRPVPTVELPVPASGPRAATLTVAGARTSQLPVLRAAAAVAGLALTSPPAADPADLLSAADGDADELADALHDGPVQSLVAARYAADAVARGGDVALVRVAVQDALVDLRRLMWHLRPRGGEPLGAALDALSDRLVEAGGPPLVRSGPAGRAERVTGPAAGAAYRLVQAVARPGAPACRVGLRVDGGSLVVVLDGGAPLTSPERWDARARALGGSLTAPSGRLRLDVPLSIPRTP